MEKQFKYDAFISYRHTELDKFVAENLHKQLESFSLPKSIAKKRPGKKNKIERVFRDKEELPLTSNLEDPILQAIQSSEWLIVICSPRLRESLWCKKEIETFVALRGRERVLAVLIEGEPSDSFPDELLFKTEKRTNPDGTVEEVKIPVEPLAADVRGKNKKEVLKAMKTEIFRLLAAMFQLDYDDLRQRHRERRMRRIVTASLIGGVACLLFGIYSTATALRIKQQNEQIEAQSAEIMKQSAEIKKQSDEIKAQNDELALRQARSLAELATQYLESGDRTSAIKIAVEALTESEGIVLPYTPEAQYILTESIRAYDTGNVYKNQYQYESAGRIEYIGKSPDGDTLLICDDTNSITLFDLEKAEVISVIGANEYGLTGNSGCAFLGEDKFAYISKDDNICIYDLNEKKIVNQINHKQATRLFTDEQGKYIVIKQWSDTFVLYDGISFDMIGMLPEIESKGIISTPYIFSEGIFACAFPLKGANEDYLYTLYFINLDTLQVISSYLMNTREVEDLAIRDGIAYLVSGEYAYGYSGSDAYISAIDIAGGALLWEHKQEGYWAELVDLPINEGATDLVFVTNGSYSLINMQTGEISHTESLSSTVVESNVYRNMNSFLFSCESGEMIVVGKDYGSMIDLSYKFECKTSNNSEILQTPYGVVVLERNDNKITVYTMKTGTDVITTDRTLEYPEDNDEIMISEAEEIVRSYGLERPEFVFDLYYDAENKYCFIRYWDYTFVIYDVVNGQVRTTIEDAYPTKWCVGTDAEGYTYLVGYYGCYVLNEDMQPVMWIPDAREVDIDNKKVYLSWNDNNYEAPLYNVEELLRIAESYNSQSQ